MSETMADENAERDDAPPVSKASYVLARLRREIADGTLKPGASLRQAALAQRYGVSATPVREALRLLEADGLIDYSPHRGATVLDLASQDIHDLYLLRADVEGFTTGLAVERRTEEGLIAIEAVQAELEAQARTAEATELSRLNRRFHFAIMNMGSALIADQVLGPLWERFIPPATTMWANPKAVRCFLDEHVAIIAAMRRGDAEAARRQMADHVMTAERLRQRIATVDPVDTE